MVISAGSFTIGSGGGYATPNTAIADIDIGGGGLTGNMDLTVISSLTENVADTTLEIPLNGFTLTVTSNSPHGGVFGQGHLISLEDQISVRVSGTGILDVKNLQMEHGSGAVFVSLEVRTSGPIASMHDNIVNAAGNFQAFPMQAINTGGELLVYNNVHANSTYAGSNNLFVVSCNNNSLLFFNNIIDASNAPSAKGFDFTYHTQPAAINIANNIAIMSSGLGFTYFGTDSGLIASKYMSNNATTDATSLIGSANPKQSFVPSVEFVSEIFGNGRYLYPVEFGQFAQGGIATNNPATADITGVPY